MFCFYMNKSQISVYLFMFHHCIDKGAGMNQKWYGSGSRMILKRIQIRHSIWSYTDSPGEYKEFAKSFPYTLGFKKTHSYLTPSCMGDFTDPWCMGGWGAYNLQTIYLYTHSLPLNICLKKKSVLRVLGLKKASKHFTFCIL